MNPFFFKFIYNFFFIKEPWNVLVLDKIKTSQPGRSLSINTKTTSMSGIQPESTFTQSFYSKS